MIVYSGSFNPITRGHVSVINSLLTHFDDDLLICPMGDFYPKDNLCSLSHRVIMIQKTLESCNIKTSRVKILEEINDIFTLETYSLLNLGKYVRGRYNESVILVIGMDNLENLKRWENNIELLNNFKLLVMPRDGYDFNSIINDSTLLKDYYLNKSNIIYCNFNLEMTASSRFRKNLKNSNPDKLEDDCYSETIEYVIKNNLYR